MAFPDLVAGIDRAAQRTLGGVVVTWRSDTWGDREVKGMFDEAYVLVDAGGQAGVEQVGPVFFCRAADLSREVSEDLDARLVLGDRQYRVIERQPDGMGGVRLLLHRIDLEEG